MNIRRNFKNYIRSWKWGLIDACEATATVLGIVIGYAFVTPVFIFCYLPLTAVHRLLDKEDWQRFADEWREENESIGRN